MRSAMFVAAVGLVCGRAAAVNVYVMSSGLPSLDAAVVATLTSHGHTATVGVTFDQFDGTQSLAGFQTVYLQANSNWTSPDMPAAGQGALAAWVSDGGRLVTSEWVIWKTIAQLEFQQLAPLFPVESSATYSSAVTTTMDLVTADPVVGAGVPASFMPPLDNYSGTETQTTGRSGATVYYSTSTWPGAAALAGWGRGAGSVFSFTSTCGATQLSDANFGRLFANVMGAGATAPCYANCDGSTTAPVLNVNDFVCFQSLFAAGNSAANCDGSTTLPTLNVNDFVCFQTRYAAGC